MSSSLNEVTLIGNACADPEVRRTQDGRAIVNLRVATSEQWRDKTSGERREKSEFHTVVIFHENLGKIAEQYVRKGSKIWLRGSLQTRKWSDKEGNDRYSTEVVLQGFDCGLKLLDGKPRDDGGIQTSSGRHVPTGNSRGRVADIDSDDIPFLPEWR